MNDWRMTLESPSCRLIFASRIRKQCLDAGLSKDLAGRAELVAAELAGNAVRHGGGGQGTFQIKDQLALIEVSDTGAPIEEADFQDNYSQGETLDPEQFSMRKSRGCGLGTVARLSNSVSVKNYVGRKVLRAELSSAWPGFDKWRERIVFEAS
ncbi:MAG: ATP-binding protein [Planctomycetota bacterium]|nr:ATP-binding protein [Planctomycetota bacterium]